MATLLSEYGVDRLAERTFSTVSVLRRVLNRYRRVCHQLDASPSQSQQDALKAQDQLHAAKLSYEFDRAHWESERQQSADAATYTAERYQDDVKELVHEHNANKRVSRRRSPNYARSSKTLKRISASWIVGHENLISMSPIS
ncbi:hypothetical protein PR001_g15949 [Phytophthora rubi]|uniref:Uncharacterized protein n=1 Tax=Phytophthora rubi TaxID=129364 RepID=A0A6A3L0E1_9STRA|nr:hypothetical protein PR001_g15949 [Phytophthora rubi]